jgi:hypothetical protein
MMKFGLLLLLVLLFTPGNLYAQRAPKPSPSPSPIVPDPTKPLLLVSFERNAIRENDAVPVRIRFTNEWDKSLSNVTIYVDSPSTLKWNATTCDQWKLKPNELLMTNQSFSLGAVAAHEVRALNMCVQSGEAIDVGEFNISFAADYSWNTDRHSLVTIEKQFKVNLFGSDAVAGIPITLAAFIVPGLFFLLMLQWLKFPLTIGGVGLGDKLIYSILTSLPLLWLVNWFNSDPNPGISFRKLSVYAVTGLAAGFAVGIAAWGWRWNQRRLLKKKVIDFDPAPEDLLGQLLKRYPDYHKPRGVILTGGQEYNGSLAVKTDDLVAIVGWFQIDQSKIDKPEILAELQGAERSIDLYDLAVKYELPLEPYEGISVNGTRTAELGKTLPAKDAEAATHDGEGKYEPIVLA